MSTLWIVAYALLAFAATIALNVIYQFLFRMLNKTRPPLVFHWVPFIGSTIHYGMDPYDFFFSCREKVSSSAL
jgi:sterol 14-demethylase